MSVPTPGPLTRVLGAIDLLPPSRRFRLYRGDVFDLVITLRVDGEPADVSDWVWAAMIDTGEYLFPFETTSLESGVMLYMRGVDTLRLPNRWCPFDVTGLDPQAGEGRTVLRGWLLGTGRITPQLTP